MLRAVAEVLPQIKCATACDLNHSNNYSSPSHLLLSWNAHVLQGELNIALNYLGHYSDQAGNNTVLGHHAILNVDVVLQCFL